MGAQCKSMRKNIKLSNKKTNKKMSAPEKEPFYFFVKDQGEGAARVIVIVLKIVELILTSIFALCLGIFGPISIMVGEINDTAVYLWMITSVVYIVGTFVVMLGHSKTALCIHGAAAAGTIVTYCLFQVMFSEIPNNNGPSVLYMPCIFITIITFVIMLLINLPKWLEKQAAKAREVAPSILAKDEEE